MPEKRVSAVDVVAHDVAVAVVTGTDGPVSPTLYLTGCTDSDTAAAAAAVDHVGTVAEVHRQRATTLRASRPVDKVAAAWPEDEGDSGPASW